MCQRTILSNCNFFVFCFSEESDPERILNILLRNRFLPGHIQGVYVQNILKLFTRIVTYKLEKKDSYGIVSVIHFSNFKIKNLFKNFLLFSLKLCDLLLTQLETFMSSGHIEVQERASSAFVLIQMLQSELCNGLIKTITSDELAPIKDGDETPIKETSNENSIPIAAIDIVHEMALLFAGDLNPVAPKAQRKVQIPENLNLDEWINLPPDDSSSSSDDDHTDLFVAAAAGGSNDGRQTSDKHKRIEPTAEELQKVCSLLTSLVQIKSIFFFSIQSDA